MPRTRVDVDIKHDNQRGSQQLLYSSASEEHEKLKIRWKTLTNYFLV